MDFYLKNNVSDIEENSHELFSIFKDFEQITELLIVTKVNNKYPGFDIQNFFKELSEHPEIYEKDDTFDLLSELLDFESFKKNLVKFKSSCKQEQTEQVQDSSFDELKKQATQDPSLKENGWTLVTKQEDMNIVV